MYGQPETVDDLRDVLFRGGFVPCDSAVFGGTGQRR